ncbi:MAG: hypothetical protein SFT68_05265 [Rickettsiaceae bacterium]|nr:hypothetical protein [Rickettsiaceae bacterium]
MQTQQKKAEIAILMPLSGPSGEQGRKLAEIIKIGLESNLNSIISTTTYDVATEEYTNQALSKMRLKRTQIILGPLFTPSVEMISPYAIQNNTIVLTLSNNPALAREDFIYVMGHQPLRQTDFLIKYLASKQFDHIILLAPNSKNALNLKKVIGEFASKQNLSLHKAYFYNSLDEIKGMVSNISNDVDLALEDDSKDTIPVILVMEENVANLQEIYNEAIKSKLDSKAVIAGDSRINIDFHDDINLLFVGSDKEINPSVMSKIKNELQINHLGYLELVAYDTGSLAALCINESFERGLFLNKLKSNFWHKGLSGDIKFQDAIAQRKYSIIERSGQSYKIKSHSN